jgi:hypothetical protein
VSAGEPWADPIAWRLAAEARASGAPVLLGDGERLPWELLEVGAPTEGLSAFLAGETARGGGVTWATRPTVAAAFGDAAPIDGGGDLEPGLATLQTAVEGGVYVGPFVLWAVPEAEIGLDSSASAAARLDGLWLGYDRGGWAVGAGKRDRWQGPGRHGALVRSTHARAPWTGAISGEGHLPGRASAAGVFRAELELGVFDRPRQDVQMPGLLYMDLRWAPSGVFELGLTRMAMFGGQGRPPVDWLQLAVPTEPHIYDDPDKLLPDQNELAAIDVRVTLPVGKWTNGPVRWVEGWWQYGGEDVIARSLGPIPYPSLAGVGNLYGAEVAVGPVVVTGEYTRLMDDTFRWYVGHRVYHDGFTQDGRVLGHWGGSDSQTSHAAVAFVADTWRARAYADQQRRVGVIEALNDKVFTFAEDERTLRFGLEGDALIGRARIEAGGSVAHVEGAGFVPGRTDLDVRVYGRATIAFGGRTGCDRGPLDRGEPAP